MLTYFRNINKKNLSIRDLTQLILLKNEEVRLDYLSGNNKGISVISMNRPQVKNAIGKLFLSQLENHLYTLKHCRNTRVVIIKSDVENTFCAGADLKERATMPPEEVAPFVDKLRSTFNLLENLPMPTIASIDGVALGGGLEMALACDIRICSKNSKIGLTETKLAIIPGAGGTQRLPRIIGIPKAKELIYTARILNGEEAEKIGLANYVTEDGQTYSKAIEIAQEMLTKGPVALRMAKLAISKGMEVDKNTGFSFEEACYAQVIPTKDRLEALSAFKEKRTPNFRGE